MGTGASIAPSVHPIYPVLSRPYVMKLNDVKTILKNHTSVVQTIKKNERIFRWNYFELQGQLDSNSNELSGYGSIKKNGKLLFEGEFLGSLRNGYGIEYNYDQVSYEGMYINDLKDGWGRTPTYQGEFCRGKRQGWGIYETSSTTYEGYWKDDLYEGMGAMCYTLIPVSDVLSYVAGEVTNQTEKPKHPTYIGYWKSGQRSGVGKFTSPYETYHGYFSNDLYHGRGCLFLGGKTYKGLFAKGKFIQ